MSYYSCTLLASTCSYRGQNQSTDLMVGPNVHTGGILTGIYPHFDHPEQYLTMLLTSQKRSTVFKYQGCDLTKVTNPEKLVAGLGSPFGLEDKAPWTSWMFNFWGFTDFSHSHKQETRGLVTIQATSFFPWWLRLFFQGNIEAKGDLLKILKSWNPEILKNHRPEILTSLFSDHWMFFNVIPIKWIVTPMDNTNIYDFMGIGGSRRGWGQRGYISFPRFSSIPPPLIQDPWMWVRVRHTGWP